jgi:hypothetical protein
VIRRALAQGVAGGAGGGEPGAIVPGRGAVTV